MIEEYTRNSWGDFGKRYLQSYGWYNETLIKLHSITEDQLVFVDESGFKYVAYPDKGNFFTFIPVEKGCYQYLDNIIILQRTPQRQWKRGINDSNTSAIDLSGNIYEISFRLLEEIFTRKDTTSFQTIPKCVAINRVFSIFNDRLWLYDREVGRINRNNSTLQCTNQMFHQEIDDLLRNYNIPLQMLK